MKRYGNLFDAIFTRDNLYQAYLDARKKKRTRRATFEFETNLGGEIEALFWELHAGTYRPQPYYKFWVSEPKPRLIHAPAFRDRVVQHAIYRAIYPIFDRTFIATSFACRTGFGTHRASRYLHRALRQAPADSYTLKLDIRKFFYNIDRNILRSQLERKIKDERLLNLMMQFAADRDGGPIGIPIGNLLSQLYALIYLNQLDHHIKRVLKVQRYLRYVDDLVFVGLTRPAAMELRRTIGQYLASELRLGFSKTTIAPIRRGVNFVGYRTWRRARFIRKHSLYKFRRAAKKGDVLAIVSILGHAKETASLPCMIKTLKEAQHENLPLPKRVRRIHGIPCPG